MNEWQEKRVLIWGKTYPELSSKYNETVCTGGTLEDGSFIRLYPIPFRYLAEDIEFSKYQWVRLRIKKSSEDPRPESFKVDPDSIILEDKVPTDKFEWFQRSQSIFRKSSYYFDSVETLVAKNKSYKTSMGFVKPHKILGIEIETRPESDHQTFLRKFQENKERSKQIDLFGSLSVKEIKELQYISKRFKVHWQCNDPNCSTHKMSILDWEAYELVRKIGIDSAFEKLRHILLSDEYNLGFFLGNFRLYPSSFTIGGIWYPKKSNLAPNLTLF